MPSSTGLKGFKSSTPNDLNGPENYYNNTEAFSFYLFFFKKWRSA
jgi:hypothetical protein